MLPRDSQRDVHLSSAGEVEGVEGHLGGGLPDGLSCQESHRLPRVTQGMLPLIVEELTEAGRTEEQEEKRGGEKEDTVRVCQLDWSTGLGSQPEGGGPPSDPLPLPVGVYPVLTAGAPALQIFLCDVMEVLRDRPEADVRFEQGQRWFWTS